MVSGNDSDGDGGDSGDGDGDGGDLYPPHDHHIHRYEPLEVTMRSLLKSASCKF